MDPDGYGLGIGLGLGLGLEPTSSRCTFRRVARARAPARSTFTGAVTIDTDALTVGFALPNGVTFDQWPQTRVPSSRCCTCAR